MDHICSFLYPERPLITPDATASFYQERLHVFSYVQAMITFFFIYYSSYNSAFLMMSSVFLIYSAQQSLYYFICIIVLAVELLQAFLFVSISSPNMPGIVICLTMIHFVMITYYAYQANRHFRKLFDEQYGENYPSISSFFKSFNEEVAIQAFIKQRELQQMESKNYLFNPNDVNRKQSLLQPLVDNMNMFGEEGMTKGQYQVTLNDPRTF